MVWLFGFAHDWPGVAVGGRFGGGCGPDVWGACGECSAVSRGAGCRDLHGGVLNAYAVGLVACCMALVVFSRYRWRGAVGEHLNHGCLRFLGGIMAWIVNGSERVCSHPFCGAPAVADVFSSITGTRVRVWSGCAEHPGIVEGVSA